MTELDVRQCEMEDDYNRQCMNDAVADSDYCKEHGS